jgi:hypothetical protein
MPQLPNEVATQIYNIYPRKVARRAALRSIVNALTRIHDGEINQKPMAWEDAYKFLITKTTQYAGSPAGNRGSLTPHPTTFFNQSRYLDHEIEWFRQTVDEERQTRLLATEGLGLGQPFSAARNWTPQ